MADHLEEPPQKRVKLQNAFQQGPSDSELLSRSDIYGLEDCLPDELVSSGWEEVLGANKPPAQGPGPGGMQQGGQQQMNGGDDNGTGNVVVVPPNVNMRTMQQQQQQQQLVQHLLQQQQQQQFGCE